MKRLTKKVTSIVLAGVMSVSMAAVAKTDMKASAVTDPYKARFEEMYQKIHDSSNGYFSPLGIPYHSVETLMCEAPDYGHETTSETFSYYLWLEAMQDSMTGNWDSFNTAWSKMEQYMIPQNSDQPPASMSRYNASSPATYAAEKATPNLYPSQLMTSGAVGNDPISSDLKSSYNRDTMYGMHWLLDTDNWYGFGTRGDGTTAPSYINTFQRGRQESVWETVTQPCWEEFNFGGTNGYLDLFTGDNSYSKQFKYTDAPDADARVVQATYDAMLWSGNNGSAFSDNIANASMMGDYLRYAMFDKYFRKIGAPSQAGSGYDSAHYLMSWYYAWGGATDGGWSWKIGCSHNHFGYQNPMTAWIMSQNSAFAPKSANGARDWNTSLNRQLELYQWLQSSEGGIAGGCSNSNNGAYEAWPAGTPTFYGMGYQQDPVYADPGSNNWFGWQCWSMQRVAEYYYTTKDPTAKAILDKWVAWVLPLCNINADGTFTIPSNLTWTGAPDTWQGTATDNSNLHVSVATYATDLGVAGSLANTLIYYSKATGNTAAKTTAQQLLDGIAANYTDSKGVCVPETRADYSRFDDPVYVPNGWTGEMPNGDTINSNSTFLSIRSKYHNDPDFAKVQAYLDGGDVPTFNYHRFWAQAEVAIANGLYSKMFGTPENNSSITPTAATFDKAAENGADINVAMTLNGNTFKGITNAGTALLKDTDYTVSGNTVTISKNYLATKDVGKLNLTFNFSEGMAQTLTVTIEDSSVIPPVTGDMAVQLSVGSTQAATNGISPHFRLVNNGTTPIDLSKVKLHYYYTKDGDKAQNFWCDWSSAGTANVTGTFVPLAASKAGADTCLEIGFSAAAGNLAPGASIEVQARFSKADWTNYNQADDYSFDGAATSYADSTKVTAYLDGSLIWGLEP